MDLSEIESFGDVLVAGLQGWVRLSERRPRLRIYTTPFHASRVPPVRLDDYVRRIMQYSSCSPVCYSVAIALMQKLSSKFEDMIPTALNAHRILLLSVMLAVKVTEDIHFDNLHFSKVGGISLGELNELEVMMLHRLNFDLRISMDDIACAEAMLIREAIAAVPETRKVLTGTRLWCDNTMANEPAVCIAVVKDGCDSPRSTTRREELQEMFVVTVKS